MVKCLLAMRCNKEAHNEMLSVQTKPLPHHDAWCPKPLKLDNFALTTRRNNRIHNSFVLPRGWDEIPTHPRALAGLSSFVSQRAHVSKKSVHELLGFAPTGPRDSKIISKHWRAYARKHTKVLLISCQRLFGRFMVSLAPPQTIESSFF